MIKVSVVIPAKNEARMIGAVLKRLEKIPNVMEVIVVDDGSGDNTADIVRGAGHTCLRLGKNFGKGYASRTGVKKANSDYIVFIDADLQLNPKEIPRFCNALKNNDLVIGKRSMKDVSFFRRRSNIFARRMIQKITKTRFDDVLCGYRAIRRDAFFSLGLKKDLYEFESEMLIRAVEKGLKIKEIPVSVAYNGGVGMSISDSIRLALYQIRELVRR